MLSENIKAARTSKVLSQEELAVKLSVVRQTISKWERGLSVPDADLLVALSEALETPVNALLGDTIEPSEPDELRVIAEKLEVVNLQLARREAARRRALLIGLATTIALIVLIFLGLVAMGSSYQTWDYSDPETAVAATILHGFEWVFMRLAPFVLIASVVGLCLVWKRGQSQRP